MEEESWNNAAHKSRKIKDPSHYCRMFNQLLKKARELEENINRELSRAATPTSRPASVVDLPAAGNASSSAASSPAKLPPKASSSEDRRPPALPQRRLSAENADIVRAFLMLRR
jgi:hypothetical protein